MDDQPSATFWNTPTLWREANHSIAQSVARHRQRMGACLLTAAHLRGRLQSIFPLMDALCQCACPACTDICCQHAWVWADFRDLLFLHLAGIPVPDQQMVSRRGEHCRYASPRGCRLDRLQRPFVCTWYLCPAQSRLLRGQPAELKRLTETLQQIKTGRRLLEDQFVQVVFREMSGVGIAPTGL